MSQLGRVKYTVPTIDDVMELARTIRAADIRELTASHGPKTAEILATSVDVSEFTLTIRVDGELLGIFGVVDISTNKLAKVGSPWLITTPLVERFPILFWKLSVMELGRVSEGWDFLVNYIDIRHTQAVRWIERLGIRLDPPAPYGVGGHPFRRFVYGKGLKNVRTIGSNGSSGRYAGQRSEEGGGIQRCGTRA